MALPKVPEEREQGAVKEQEMLVDNNPTPPEATPAAQEEAAIEAAVAQATPVEQGAQQAPPPQQGYRVRNPYMLLPQGANLGRVTGQRQKTPSEASYDAGLLLDVLGRDDPVFAQIAKELKRD